MFIVALKIMKVSALIPTYNRRDYVFRAIASVLSQTTQVDEIVVVDDGSTDGTADEIRARLGDKVRLVRQRNTGVSGARLRAIQEARGEWVAFLDSDDEWLPDRQKQLLAAVELLPSDVAWLFADMRIVTDDGDQKTFFGHYGLNVGGQPEIFEDSLRIQFPFQFPMLQGSLIRRSALLEARCFEDGLRSDDDFLTGFQIACRYRFAAIPSVVTTFYRTSDLFQTSVQYNGVSGPDYYRSRMAAYSLAIKKTGKKEPWAGQYAHVVRGLCKLQTTQGRDIRGLAKEQFRFAISVKSIAFYAAALLGAPGLKSWDLAGSWFRGLADSLGVARSQPIRKLL